MEMRCNMRDEQIDNQSITQEKLFEFNVGSVISTGSWKAFQGTERVCLRKLMGDPRADEPGVKLMDRATIRLQKCDPRTFERNTNFPPRWRMSKSFHFVIHSSGSFFLSPHVSSPTSLGRSAFRRPHFYPYPYERKFIRKIPFFLRRTIDDAWHENHTIINQ